MKNKEKHVLFLQYKHYSASRYPLSVSKRCSQSANRKQEATCIFSTNDLVKSTEQLLILGLGMYLY